MTKFVLILDIMFTIGAFLILWKAWELLKFIG